MTKTYSLKKSHDVLILITHCNAKSEKYIGQWSILNKSSWLKQNIDHIVVDSDSVI